MKAPALPPPLGRCTLLLAVAALVVGVSPAGADLGVPALPPVEGAAALVPVPDAPVAALPALPAVPAVTALPAVPATPPAVDQVVETVVAPPPQAPPAAASTPVRAEAARPPATAPAPASAPAARRGADAHPAPVPPSPALHPTVVATAPATQTQHPRPVRTAVTEVPVASTIVSPGPGLRVHVSTGPAPRPAHPLETLRPQTPVRTETPSRGLRAESAPPVAAASAPPATKSRSLLSLRLPFTGLALLFPAALALIALILGLVLRRSDLVRRWWN